jgi:hypothetical protein
LQPHQVAQLTTPAPNTDGSPNVQTINTCGGDDVSYNIPLSGPVVFDGVTFNSLYVTTNSVIAFGQPDGTFHDFPMTPSISLFSQDWVAYPTFRTDEAFTIAHSHQGFQVTLKVRPYSNQGTPTLTTIVFTASYNQDRSLNISYYADNVTQYQTRTGVRLNNGTVVPFSQAGITQETTIPVVPGDPEPDPAPTITGTEVGDTWAKVFVQGSSAVTATAWRYQVLNTQQSCANPYANQTLSTETLSESILLSGLTNGCQYTVKVAHWDGDVSLYAQTIVTPVAPYIAVPTGVEAVVEGNTITLTWNAPAESTVPIERYAVFWSYDNFNTGFAISSTTTSATITEVPYGVTVSIKVRADNDTNLTYSDFSQPVQIIMPEAPESSNTDQVERTDDVIRTDDPATADNTRTEDVERTEDTERETGLSPPSSNTPTEPVTPEPIPLPEEPVIEPSPEPITVPPTEEPAPEPTPSKEPAKEPEENEPDPLPEPEPSSPSEELGELAEIDPSNLTDEQAVELFALALEIFETAEVGSEEYQQALDALMIVAQSDDPELPAELAAIPLLGDIAGAILDVFNSLGNVGSDMSPEVRETAEKIVVVSIVVAQIVGISAISAMSSTSIRRP